MLRQYERAFRAYGIEISFEDEALHLMAEAAAKEKTGARGLLTVFEKLFRDYKYYLAGSGLSQLRVTAELVREPKRVLERLMAEGHKQEEVGSISRSMNLRRSIQAGAWTRDRLRRIRPVRRLVERAQTERMTMAGFARICFKIFNLV